MNKVMVKNFAGSDELNQEVAIKILLIGTRMEQVDDVRLQPFNLGFDALDDRIRFLNFGGL